MNGGGLRSKRWFAPFDLALRRCVVADGMFGDVECVGDVPILHALRHQSSHLAIRDEWFGKREGMRLPTFSHLNWQNITLIMVLRWALE